MNFCFGRGSIPRRVWRAGAHPFLARKSGGHCNLKFVFATTSLL